MESEKPDKDLIVDVTPTEVHIALMENHRLIEYNTESSTGNKFTVGDVHLGKVKKILPNLNAAFVDIGDKKEAFIHYLDLGLYFHAFDQFVRESNQNTNLTDLYSRISIGTPLPKEGKIEEILKPGQMIVAQIVKEPISTKGSRLTAEISLAAHELVRVHLRQLGMGLDILPGDLRGLLHDIAQVAGHRQDALALGDGTLDEEDLAAELGPGEAGHHARGLVALLLVVEGRRQAQVLAQVFLFHHLRILLLQGDLLRRHAGDLRDLLLQAADAGLVRVLVDPPSR